MQPTLPEPSRHPARLATAPSPRWGRPGGLLLAASLLLLGLRVAARWTWHVPAGDGLQYFQLAHELRLHHRLAFAGPPAPLTAARLPGYPLFIALFGWPLDIETHLVVATLLNQLLDATTALLVLQMARERGLGARAGGLAAVLVLACPILLYLSCYGLTESLATCLLTAELFLAVRTLRDGSPWSAAGAGLFAGLAQLVRPDAVAMVPVTLCAVALAAAPARRRGLAAAAFALAALLVFSPWPARNLIQFGAPHPFAASWEKQDGSELPGGLTAWLRTWCRGAPGETYLFFLVANDRAIDLPRNLRPEMFDDAAERQRLLATIEQYNRRRSLADADAGFRALAAERTRRAPLRTLVTLPLLRMVAEWSPIPEWELPMRTAVLGLPQARAGYARFEQALFVLGLVGAVLLAGRDPRLVALVLLSLAVRTVLFAYLIPFPVERYMAEAVPGLLLLSACTLDRLAAAVVGQRRRRSPSAPGGAGAPSLHPPPLGE